MMSALFAVWTAFSFGQSASAEETMPEPPAFRKVLVLFSADMTKDDRDAFLAGLDEVRLRHRKEDSENASSFLDVVDVLMIRTGRENPSFDESLAGPRMWDLESLPALTGSNNPAEALIVVASDAVSADLTRMIRTGLLESGAGETVVLFAGVSSFDESIRTPHGTDTAKAPNAFAIQHPVDDPWPNTELALMSFPKTRKIILLAPAGIWDKEREGKYRDKLGPGKTLATILMPDVPNKDATETGITALQEQFVASVKAEIQPETVIVSLSSTETGRDPIAWLPKDFKDCPIFADTKPVLRSMVGGFCRSMNSLGVQAADLLEQLGENSLSRNKLPALILENDELWLNSHAIRKYGLKTASFPDTAMLMSTSSTRAPVRLGYTLTRKRVVLLVLANLFVIFGLFAYAMTAIRASRRKREIAESVYSALPVRVLVMDRDGRLLEYHRQYGEVEQKGEFPWKNIKDVPWLQGLGLLQSVQEAFDTGKTVVREVVIEGERRAVVLSRTESNVFGRPAVIAVSSDTPKKDA